MVAAIAHAKRTIHVPTATTRTTKPAFNDSAIADNQPVRARFKNTVITQTTIGTDTVKIRTYNVVVPSADSRCSHALHSRFQRWFAHSVGMAATSSTASSLARAH